MVPADLIVGHGLRDLQILSYHRITGTWIVSSSTHAPAAFTCHQSSMPVVGDIPKHLYSRAS